MALRNRNSSLTPGSKDFADAPTIEVRSRFDMSPDAAENWRLSELAGFGAQVEEWTSDASTHALRYATHGLFRYFGKFPPTIPRHLIQTFSSTGDAIIDPMIGSGTTAVEALLLKRACFGSDVSPLSALLSRVKTTPIDAEASVAALDRISASLNREITPILGDSSFWPTDIKTGHFFMPETAFWLHQIRSEIELVEDSKIRELFLACFASIIRKASRATSQQGRQFLDVDSAVADPRKMFLLAVEKAIQSTSSLPTPQYPIQVQVIPGDSAVFPCPKSPLIICHPPYFNGYRYSSIFSFELAWLGVPVKSVSSDEVKEFFKVGKPEKVTKYLDGMVQVLRNADRFLAKGGTLALMIGDTNIHGNRVLVTKQLLTRVADILRPTKVAIRTPKFTEASWVASQRRTASKVGIRILDYVVLLEKVGQFRG